MTILRVKTSLIPLIKTLNQIDGRKTIFLNFDRASKNKYVKILFSDKN